MGIMVEHEEAKSPFLVLREQIGISVEDMADAIYVKPDMLTALEADEWEKVTVGLPVWSDLLARVACVVAGRTQFPFIGRTDITNLWMEGMMEVGNSFNQASWR